METITIEYMVNFLLARIKVIALDIVAYYFKVNNRNEQFNHYNCIQKLLLKCVHAQ